MGTLPTPQLIEQTSTGFQLEAKSPDSYSLVGVTKYHFAYRWVTRLVALVLLVAATLKVWSVLPERGSTSWFAWNGGGILAVAAFEWGLAVWLLSGIAKLWARRTILSTLGVFLIISAREWLSGHTDCGCFGQTPVHPGITTSFDVAALIAIGYLGHYSVLRQRNAVIKTSAGQPLQVSRHERDDDALQNRGRRAFLKSSMIALLLVIAILGIILSWASYRSGSVARGIAFLAGNNVYFSSKNLTVSGKGGEGELLRVSNLSEEKLRILGYNAECSCVKISGLPIELGPLESKQLVVAAVSDSDKKVGVSFITDGADQDFARIQVTVIGNH